MLFRSMFPDRGCSPDLAEVNGSVLDGVTALHVPMYSLTNGLLADTATRLISEAHMRNILVSIDASSVSVLENFGVTESLALIDRLTPSVLLCNDDEARVLNLDSLPNGVGTLVVKRGSRPVQVFDSSGTREFVVAPVEHVVDTTGAGDAFAAGFLTALVTTHDLAVAVDAGHALAVRALSSPGATLGAMEQR